MLLTGLLLAVQGAAGQESDRAVSPGNAAAPPTGDTAESPPRPGGADSPSETDAAASTGSEPIGGGLTAFGLVPGRPDDTFGVGLAWTALNRADQAGHVFYPDALAGPLQLRPSQLMLAAYYQMKVVDGCFLQTTLTDIPNPGENASIPNALAITFRLIVLY